MIEDEAYMDDYIPQKTMRFDYLFMGYSEVDSVSTWSPDGVHYWVNWWGPPWLATRQWGSLDYRWVPFRMSVSWTDCTTGWAQKQKRNIFPTIKLWFCLSIPVNNICHILLDCKMDLRSIMAVIGTRSHIVTTSCMLPIDTLWSCQCWSML